MKIDLSKVSTTSLTEELSRRSDEIGKNVFEVELRAIKKRIKRMALEFAVEYTTSFAGEKCLMFVLGIITNGQFKDFYHNSDLPYDVFGELIPSCFNEAMESTYEFSPSVGYNSDLDSALEILKKAGYTSFTDATEKYE